jgi:hypothetical protein
MTAVGSAKENKEAPVLQHVTFNRFEFTFDAKNSTIAIGDVLDASETGSQLVTPGRVEDGAQRGTTAALKNLARARSRPRAPASLPAINCLLMPTYPLT